MIKLTKQQAIEYKQRWQRLESMQVQELRTMSMSLKFKQLCFLMNSFRFEKEDEKREKEVEAVRKRWMKLRKRWDNGH